MTGKPPPMTTPHSSPPPTKSKKEVLTAAKGGGILFVGKIFTYVGRFAITFILARFLEAQDFGLYSLAIMSITMAGILAAFGLDTTIMRFIALSKGKKDQAGIWGAIQVCLAASIVLSMILALGLYFTAEPIAVHLFDEPRLTPLLRWSSLFVSASALEFVIIAATQGFKKMQYTVITRGIFKLWFRFGVTIILLMSVGLTATNMVIVFGLSELATAILGLYFLNKIFPLSRPFGQARRDVKVILGFSLPVYLTNIIQLTRNNVQTILLGGLNGVISVGVFTVASRVTLIGEMFTTSIAGSVTPIIAELYGRDDIKQIGYLYQTVTKWIVTFNLPFFLTLITFPEQILSIFGETFTNGAMALTLLAWASMIDSGTGICGRVIDMTGYTKLKLFNSVVSVVLSLGLNLLLIPIWGMVGAAITTIVVISVVNGLRLGQVYILLRLLPYNIGFLKPITATLAALATITLTASWFPPEENLIYIGLQVATLFIVYAGILLLLGISAEDRAVLRRLRQRTGKMIAK